jgi:hypothetical protein
VSVFVVTGVVLTTSPGVVRLSEALPASSYLFENVASLVVLLLPFYALLLAVPGVMLYKPEQSQSIELRDHAWHYWALLYAGLALVLVVLLAIPDPEAGMLQHDPGLALCAVAAYGIMVDTGVVLSMRRPARARPGGGP